MRKLKSGISYQQDQLIDVRSIQDEIDKVINPSALDSRKNHKDGCGVVNTLLNCFHQHMVNAGINSVWQLFRDID